MAVYNCDNCFKEFEEKDKYNKLRCAGQCRRHYCMNCSRLDKTTTKMLILQKHPQIRFFCDLCDSPNLKYLHDKVTDLAKRQVTTEKFDSLAIVVNKLANVIPTITEIYDLLITQESQWNLLSKKLNGIEKNPEYLLSSVKQIKQDVSSLMSTFCESTDDLFKVQVHVPNSADLKIASQETHIKLNQVSSKLMDLDKKVDILHQTTKKQNPTIKQVTSSSTQTDLSKTKEEWHYVEVTLISKYSISQVVHYIKDKLKINNYIRCTGIPNSSENQTVLFKIGLNEKTHALQLLEKNFWPLGSLVNWSSKKPENENRSFKNFVNYSQSRKSIDEISETTFTVAAVHKPHVEDQKSSTSLSLPLSESCSGLQSVLRNSDTEAIALGNNNSLAIDSSFDIDPLTPPRVELTKKSEATDGRYLLSRLREPAIMESLRLYLAYLHDQESALCYEGSTCTSVRVFLASEGLPTDLKSLRNIYYNFHNTYGIDSTEVDNDLSSFRAYLTSKRLIHLQSAKQSQQNYLHSPQKNF